jgi:hypothetical protein
MNVFEVIASVTSRIEPFHSRYLAAELRESLAGDRRFFDGFWALATGGTSAWPLPPLAEVAAEDPFEDGQRVDLVVFVPARGHPRQVLGIEVKTRDASAAEGQLRGYHERLCAKYPTAEVRLAYLTPFTRRTHPEHADRLRAVQEAETLGGTLVHLSWGEVSALPHRGGEVWEHHREFVRTRIADPAQLHRAALDRGLGLFFGDECATRFWDALQRVGVDLTPDPHAPDTVTVRLSVVREPDALVEAFRILVDSSMCASTRQKDDLPETQRRYFLDSAYGDVHARLFALAREYDHVWVGGRRRYGLRVSHQHHRSGVSLCTAVEPGVLEIILRR